MSAPAIIREPYRKHPATPLDLSWVDRSNPKPVGGSDVEAAARTALVRLGAGDLLGMLFDPPRVSRRRLVS